MLPVETIDCRRGGRLLALVGLLATLTACVSSKPPKILLGEPASPPVPELFATLYGPLANPDFPRRASWRLGGGFGAADLAVGELLDHWQHRQRPYLASLRRQGFSRRQFYAEIETWLDDDDFRLPRATLQRALAEPLAADQRQRLEAVLTVHEHAYLTYAAVVAANRLTATPDELANLLPALRRLPAFRREFAAWLPTTLERLAASERLAGDAAGEELVELLPKPLGDFLIPVGGLRWQPDPDNLGEAGAWFAEPASDDQVWQPLPSPVGLPRGPAVADPSGASWFAITLGQPPRSTAGERRPAFLVVWSATVAVDLYVDGHLVGALRPLPAIPHSGTFAIPVPAPAPGEADSESRLAPVRVVLRAAGDCRQLPCRGMWVVYH